MHDVCRRWLFWCKRSRPALSKLIDNLSKVDLVLVYKLDRLTRNVKDLLDLLEIFEENNVAFRVQQKFTIHQQLWDGYSLH